MKIFRFTALICSLLFLSSGCVTFTPAAKDELEFTIIHENINASKSEIYKLTKMYIAQNFKSAKAVIEYDDIDSGTIIGNGSIDYPKKTFNDEIVYSGWKALFTMKVEAKDNKFRITYSNLYIDMPYTPSINRPAQVVPVAYKEQLDYIKPELLKIGDKLAKFCSEQKESMDW